MKNAKKLLCGVIALAFILVMFAGCTKDDNDVIEMDYDIDTPPTEAPTPTETITYTYPEFKIEITSDSQFIYERMLNYYFIPDDEVLGTWQVDAVLDNVTIKYIDEYDENSLGDFINSKRENIYAESNNLETIKLYDDGRAKITLSEYSFFTEWTNGHILNLNFFPDNISKYIIKNAGGAKYMAAEKKGLYSFEYEGAEPKETPVIIILKKISGYVPEKPDDFLRYDTIKRSYDWYVSQRNTGEYSNVNCGPACAVMGAKWYDKDFKTTVEEARNRIYIDYEEIFKIHPEYSGEYGWNISVMKEFFDSENIPCEQYVGIKYEDVIMQLNMGNILIVPVYMEYIKKNNFNNNNASHYIIIKGKRTIDGQEYFQAHDPALERDCLYLCDEVIEAATNNSGMYIVVQNNEAFENLDSEPAPIPDEIPEYINIQGGLYNTAWTSLALSGELNDSDIESLSDMVNLKSFILYDSKISDVSALTNALKQLANLTYLNLSNDQIIDVTALAELKNLTDLCLNYNQISDVSLLAEYPNLTALYLVGNQINDVSVLAGMTDLKWLNLSNNEIDNVSVLAGLTKLAYLDVRGNPINAEQVAELREALSNTEIISDY